MMRNFFQKSYLRLIMQTGYRQSILIFWICLKLILILAMVSKNPADFIYGGF